VSLYLILPSLQQQVGIWITCCVLSGSATGIGVLWIFKMAEEARWGGLAKNRRSWLLASQCAGERILALIRAGSPPDLAWTQICERLEHDEPGLFFAWGAILWKSPEPRKQKSHLATLLGEAGNALRKSIQISLMDGKPCLERIESTLTSLKLEIRAQMDRELELLATRALKPLFLCVAPALLGLIGSALALECWQSMGAWSGL
jgi:hypothetical protein